jgi:ABC-type amino acid transport substrate-binding protein
MKTERDNRSLHRGAERLVVVTLAWLSLVDVAAAQTPVPQKPDLAARLSNSGHLRGGWYPWDPYQYRDYRRGVPVLTGFDVEIERALARIMGVEILLPEIAWEDHLAALAAGTADIASGATASEERSRYAYFSKPYRTETDVLILPPGAPASDTLSAQSSRCSTPSRSRSFGWGSLPGSFMPTRASMPSLRIRLTGIRSFL